jgi:hypothetical protein
MEEPPQQQTSQPKALPSKKSNPIPFIVGAIIIFGLGLLAGYLLSGLAKTSPTTIQKSPTITTAPQSPIKDLMQVQKPSGWTEKITQSISHKEYLNFISPDMVPGATDSAQTHAVTITFDVIPHQHTVTIDREYQLTYDQIHHQGVFKDSSHTPLGGVVHDLTKTTIVDYPAIAYYLDYNGYNHIYFVQVGDSLWHIVIYTPEMKYEKQHQAEIDAVLSSIKFTK